MALGGETVSEGCIASVSSGDSLCSTGSEGCIATTTSTSQSDRAVGVGSGNVHTPGGCAKVARNRHVHADGLVKDGRIGSIGCNRGGGWEGWIGARAGNISTPGSEVHIVTDRVACTNQIAGMSWPGGRAPPVVFSIQRASRGDSLHLDAEIGVALNLIGCDGSARHRTAIASAERSVGAITIEIDALVVIGDGVPTDVQGFHIPELDRLPFTVSALIHIANGVVVNVHLYRIVHFQCGPVVTCVATRAPNIAPGVPDHVNLGSAGRMVAAQGYASVIVVNVVIREGNVVERQAVPADGRIVGTGVHIQ